MGIHLDWALIVITSESRVPRQVDAAQLRREHAALAR